MFEVVTLAKWVSFVEIEDDVLHDGEETLGLVDWGYSVR